jgi:hypothetical protein
MGAVDFWRKRKMVPIIIELRIKIVMSPRINFKGRGFFVTLLDSISSVSSDSGFEA